MAISKRGGIWHINLQFRGERIRRSTGTSDKSLAQRLHDELKASLWNQKVLNQQHWKRAALEYFQGRNRSGSYDADIKRLIILDEWCGDKLCKDVNQEVGSKIKTALALKGLKPPTVNRYLTLLISILNYAADQGWIDTVPRIKKLKEGTGRLEYLTPEEVKRLLVEVNEQHLTDFITLAIATGIRKRNLTHLEWDNVDLFRRTITIHADEHKNGKVHVAPINQMAMDVLKRLHRPSGRVLLFRGKPMDDVGRKALKTAAKRAGITKNVFPHIFRHTFASWHIMKGTSLPELKELGGWSKLDSVLIYAHLNIEHLKEASREIEEALSL